MAGIRIDALDATATPSRDHEVPAIKDGATVRLSVDQIIGLIAPEDIEPTVEALVVTKADKANPFVDVASAATVDLGAASSFAVNITGSTGPITSFGTSAADGTEWLLKFASTPTINNGASLITPEGTNIVAFAGMTMRVRKEPSNVWRVLSYTDRSYVTGGGSYRVAFNASGLSADTTYTLPSTNSTLAREWTELAAVSVSGAAVDWTSIPSGVNEIELWFNLVSVTSTQHLLVQVGTGGTPTTTGYTGGTGVAGANVTASSTSGFALFSNSATLNHTGIFRLFRTAGTNTWTASIAMYYASNGSLAGGGVVTLSGTLDNVRLTRDGGSQTFDAGSVVVRYR